MGTSRVLVWATRKYRSIENLRAFAATMDDNLYSVAPQVMVSSLAKAAVNSSKVRIVMNPGSGHNVQVRSGSARFRCRFKK